jgi:hypothetical protein
MNDPVLTGSAEPCGTPATNPHTTAMITIAAVTFDILALENIGVLSSVADMVEFEKGSIIIDYLSSLESKMALSSLLQP